MGFSLAQMSLNFIIPAHAAEVYTHSAAPIAFVLTFTIVASTWYSHHWLFERLFVPTPFTLFVNFATLASLIWLVYQFQVYLHFAPSTHESQVAMLSYFLTFAATWLLLGILYGTCLRLRWNALTDADRRPALFKTGRITTFGLATAGGTVAMWTLHKPVELAVVVMIAVAALYRVAARAGGLRG